MGVRSSWARRSASRPRQEKLNWWDRFQVADGILAASARFLVAATVVGAVIVVGALLAFHQRGEDLLPDVFQQTVPPSTLPEEQPVLGIPEERLAPADPTIAPSESLAVPSIDSSVPLGEGLPLSEETPVAPEGEPSSPSAEPETAPQPESGQ